MATQEAICQVCFVVKKCRTKYMGRVGLFVCTNSDCLTINTDRKKEAKQLAVAEKAAAKKTLQEAKAKERAAKTAAKAHARPPAVRSPRNPAAKKAATGALPFYQDQDKVTDDLSGEDNAVGLRAAAPTLAADSTPSRPPSARKKAVNEGATRRPHRAQRRLRGQTNSPRSARRLLGELRGVAHHGHLEELAQGRS